MLNPNQSYKISIIIVCYNAATIGDTIESIIDQTYANIEFIIIDGASTDGTMDIIKKYGHSITKWITEKDNGIYDAMNKGLKMATGDFLFFIGADDILFDNSTIEKVAGHLKEPNDIYYGDAYFKNSKKIYHINPKKWTLSMRNISHQALFYPKIVYQHIPYDLKYRLFSDHIYNIKLFASKQYKFNYIPVTVSVYNDGGGQSSQPNDPAYFKDLPGVVSEHFGKPYGLYVFLRLVLFKTKIMWSKIVGKVFVKY